MRISWVFGTLVLGLIPLLSRFIVSFLAPPMSWCFVLNPIDISFLALAFNWSNINESCRLFNHKKKKKQSNDNTIAINLFVSAVFIIFIAFTLTGLYLNDKKSEEIISPFFAAILSSIICVISGITSYIFIGKINKLIYENK